MDRLRGSMVWLLALIVAASLSGCGDISIPGIPGMGGSATATPATGPGQPTAVVKSGATTAQVGGQLPATFPSGFPLPQQYQLQSAVDDGRQIAVVLTVPAAQPAYDFYKGALPGAGYQVRELGGANVAGAFSGGLSLSGNGFSGEVAVTGVGASPLVSIRLERGGSAAPGQAPVAPVAPVQPGAPTVAAKPGQPSQPGQPSGTTTGALPAGFPPTFPLPPQYQVQSASDNGRQIAVVLSVQSAQAAYDFYKGALALAGYQVREEGAPRTSGGLFTGGLTFTGNGQTGTMAFSSAGATNLVTIGLERGGAATTGTVAPAIPPAQTVATPTAASKPAASTPQATAGLPAGFPMPPQAQVQVSTNDGQQTAVVLGVPSAKDAYDFYQKSLPGAGYQMSDVNGVDGPGGTFGGLIKITGNGITGEMAFSGNPAGNTVAIRFERAGASQEPAPPPAKPGPGSGQTVAGLPAGFPMPPDHRVQAAANNGNQIAVVLNVPSSQAAFDFYKGALPGAGYQVTERAAGSRPDGGFNGVLSIRGNGVAGEVVCTSASGQNIVAISLNKT